MFEAAVQNSHIKLIDTLLIHDEFDFTYIGFILFKRFICEHLPFIKGLL